MTIVSFTKKHYSKEDILEVLNSVRSYLPLSHKGLIDGLKSVFGILNGGKITNKSLYPMIRDWKAQTNINQNKEIDNLYRCLVECYVLLVDAKLQEELKENDKRANKILHKAETILNETIVCITNQIIIQLNQSVGVKIIRRNKSTNALELEIGTVTTNNFQISDIEPYIRNFGRLTIGNIFYVPQTQKRKGFFSSFLYSLPDALSSLSKQESYQQEIKVWLDKFLEELSNEQKLIGRSVLVFSFLNKYCSIAKHAKNKLIRERKGWHTTICRWVTFVVSSVITIAYFVIAYMEELTKETEMPRVPYIPPEIADTQQVFGVENLWVYDTLKNVALIVGCIFLLELFIVELRIFLPTFKVWRTYVSRKFTSLNYLLNFHPSFISLVICIIGCIVCGTYMFCLQLFLQGKTFSRAEVLDSLSSKTPYEGALFYVKNRNHIEFLDSIYEYTIIPALESCDYLELKEVNKVLRNTKYNHTISSWMAEQRPKFLQSIKAEIGQNEKSEIRAVDNYIIPTLNLELDSLIENNVDDILNSYSGGVLNYRKLAFLVGRDSSKFVSIFDKNVDVMGFSKTVSEYAQNSMLIITHQQSKYCKALTGKAFNNEVAFTFPKPTVNLSKNTVDFIQTYTDNETKEMIVSAVDDYATSIATGFVSGGASLIYDIADIGYGILQAFQNNEMSQEAVSYTHLTLPTKA